MCIGQSAFKDIYFVYIVTASTMQPKNCNYGEKKNVSTLLVSANKTYNKTYLNITHSLKVFMFLSESKEESATLSS